MTQRQKTLCGFFLSALTAALLFLSTLTHPFFYDDIFYVQKNPAIRAITPQAFLHPFSPVAPGLYRPLTTLSYAVEYAFFGEKPSGYHASNILLHALVSGVLFLFSFRILRDFFGALVSALVFAVHPVHTEAVTWISGQSELLAALFVLLSALSFLRFRESGHSNRFLFLGLAGVCYFLAISAKEIAAPLPFVLLLLETSFPKSQKNFKEILRSRFLLPYGVFILALGCSLVFRAIALGGLTVPLEHIRTAGLSFLERMLLMFPVIAHYLRLLVFPLGLRVEYDWTVFPLWLSLAAALLLLGILFLGGWLWKRGLWAIGFGIFWFFLFLLPVANILPIGEIAAERFLYLPSAGFCFSLGALAVSTRERFSLNAALAFLLVILLSFSFLTGKRNAEWRDPKTLWRSTLTLSPAAPHALENLASILLAEGETLESGVLLDRARARWPNEPSLLSMKAQWHFLRSEREAGLRLLEEALRLAGPTNIGFNEIHRGGALLTLGRFEEALQFFENAVRVNPSDPVLFNNLGIAQAQLGRIEEAKQSFRRSIALFESQTSLSEDDQKNYEGTKLNLQLLEGIP